MNLGRISVKKIFLLTCGGMAASMLAICAVLLWMTGESWVLITGGRHPRNGRSCRCWCQMSPIR